MSFNSNPTVSNNFYAAATGTSSSSVFIDVFETRDPTANDVNYPVQKKWLNTNTGNFWELIGFTSTGGGIQADWLNITAGISALNSLSGNSGGFVFPTVGNIKLFGDTTTIVSLSEPGSSEILFMTGPLVPISFPLNIGTVTAGSGVMSFLGAVVPAAGVPIYTDGVTGTININVQVTESAVSSDIANAGLSSFNSADFTVDANGYVSLSSSGLGWIVITVSQSAVAGGAYFCNGGALVQVVLPVTSNVGDTFEVYAMNANGFQITQNAGQQIRLGKALTTLGAGGSIESTFAGDHLTLVCNVANTSWAAMNCDGNLTVV